MSPTTRERILDEALRLFLVEGYAAASLRAIADAVGVTQAAVYYHFRAKDDLLADLLAAPLDDLEVVLDEAERRRVAEGIVDRRALLAAVHDHLRRWPEVVRLRERDVVVAEHPRWRPRADALWQRCAALLAGGAAGPSRVLADSALAMLTASVVAEREPEPGERELLLDAAQRVLDTPIREPAEPHQPT